MDGTFKQLDGWLGERQKSEAEAGASLVTMMREAIEKELTLPLSLQLQGDHLVIDETLLMLPPPPPPPVAPAAQDAQADQFSVAQLAGLVTKLKAASEGSFITSAALKEALCRLGAAGFDAAAPPLPEVWWPLGPPQYEHVVGLFCPPGAPQVAWCEVVFALAALPAPSEEQIVSMLTEAATAAGRTELLEPPPPVAEEDKEAAEAPPAVPARVGLRLTRAQYDALPLWIEGGVACGNEHEKLLKQIFTAIDADGNGTLDPFELKVAMGLKTESENAAHFAWLDEDKDAAITLPEFVAKQLVAYPRELYDDAEITEELMEMYHKVQVNTRTSGTYQLTAATKDLLWEALADKAAGTVDMQQLLLYVCDTPAKAFACLGFHTQKMLALDGVYELLHRTPPNGGVEPPEHLDPYSRSVLTRLFTELKLSTSERAPYAAVVSHPAGAKLLGGCAAYTPKDVYGKVGEITGAAGRSLMI